MNLLSVLIDNLLSVQLKNPSPDEIEKEVFFRTNLGRSQRRMVCYLEALKNGPLTTQEIAEIVGVQNARPVLTLMRAQGYVKNLVYGTATGKTCQKTWEATGKPLN